MGRFYRPNPHSVAIPKFSNPSQCALRVGVQKFQANRNAAMRRFCIFQRRYIAFTIFSK